MLDGRFYHVLTLQTTKRIASILFDNPEEQNAWVSLMVMREHVKSCTREMCKDCELECNLKPKEANRINSELMRKWMVDLNDPLDDAEDASDRRAEHRPILREMEDQK